MMNKGKSPPTSFSFLIEGETIGHSSTSTIKVNMAAGGGADLPI